MTAMTQLPHGMFIYGTVKGYRANQRPGAQFPNHEIGVEIQTPDGWGGTKNETIVVRVSKSLVDQGIPALANSLKERLCLIPVYVTAWAGQKGAGVNYNLSNHASIQEVEA